MFTLRRAFVRRRSRTTILANPSRTPYYLRSFIRSQVTRHVIGSKRSPLVVVVLWGFAFVTSLQGSNSRSSNASRPIIFRVGTFPRGSARRARHGRYPLTLFFGFFRGHFSFIFFRVAVLRRGLTQVNHLPNGSLVCVLRRPMEQRGRRMVSLLYFYSYASVIHSFFMFFSIPPHVFYTRVPTGYRGSLYLNGHALHVGNVIVLIHKG